MSSTPEPPPAGYNSHLKRSPIQIHINADYSGSPSPASHLLPKIQLGQPSIKGTPSLGLVTSTSGTDLHASSSSSSHSTADVQPATESHEKSDPSPRSSSAHSRRWRNLINAQLRYLELAHLGRGARKTLRGAGEEGWKRVRRWGKMLWVPASEVERRSAGEAAAGTEGRKRSGLHRAVLAADRHRQRIGVGRTSSLVVLLLLAMGLWELLSRSLLGSVGAGALGQGSHGMVRVKGRDPLAVLRDVGVTKDRRWNTVVVSPGETWMTAASSSSSARRAYEPSELPEEADVTAIVLNWKRPENVKVVVAHLCRFTFFRTVLVWNNNPEEPLVKEDFASLCPSSKLRLFNSPRNLLFLARYLACSTALTPYCYFQDDDWLVGPVRAMYSVFRRDPEGPVVVATEGEMRALTDWEWCFFNKPLHACFSWLGTGAFLARSHVERFLTTTSILSYPSYDLSHADNSFTLFQNEPSYVLSGGLVRLPAAGGYSDGKRTRNKDLIERGLGMVTAYLDPENATFHSLNEKQSLPQPQLHLLPAARDKFASPSLPLPAHPWAHHLRSPCSSDSCIFLTSLQLFPPPEIVAYPGPPVELEEWENHLGSFGRGWSEGKKGVWEEGEEWARRWGWEGAVDGREGTAFRSLDVVRKNDYVGLSLLHPIQVPWTPTATLHFMMDDLATLLPLLVIEVSKDGYRWLAPFPPDGVTNRESKPTCKLSRHRSTKPSPPFPKTFMSSPAALSAISSSPSSSSSWLSFLRRTSTPRSRSRAQKTGQRVLECEVKVSSKVSEESAEGWMFWRLRAASDAQGAESWGVYGLWTT